MKTRAAQRGFYLPHWGTSVTTDPSFANVVFLAHADAVGVAPLTPEVYAGGTLGFPVGASCSGTEKVFGAGSIRSSTANGGAYTSTGFAIGTVDATIEFWVRLDSVAITQVLFDCRPASTSGVYFALTAVNAELRYSVNSITRISQAGALSATTWHFIAWSRVSGSSRLYCTTLGNATAPQVGSTFTDSLNLLNGDLGIGASAFPGSHTGGYFDDIRVTVGVGRYSGATCPVPSAAWPNS